MEELTWLLWREIYLLEFLERVNKHIDALSPIEFMYLDLQKAFDKYPQQKATG